MDEGHGVFFYILFCHYRILTSHFTAKQGTLSFSSAPCYPPVIPLYGNIFQKEVTFIFFLTRFPLGEDKDSLAVFDASIA
jgi:hypothetical protein